MTVRRVPRHVGPRICLNMIVKDEAARIARCLVSVAPHVHCWAITDTGSTDQTRETIRDLFGSRGLHGHLGESKFSNFRDTRNVALDMALKLRGDLAWDYLLLCDADMELVAPDGLSLGAPGYQMIQRNAGMEYWNARLLRHDNPARYVLVTHEYLSTEQPLEKLHAVCLLTDNVRALILRKTARSLATSALKTWERDVVPQAMRELIHKLVQEGPK